MTRIIIPDDFDQKVFYAVESFWKTRSRQKNRQGPGGLAGQGNRSAVTGGKQLDSFVKLFCDLLILNRVPEKSIFTDFSLELPGFYRPNKKWDLLVVDRGRLIIAIEFKSQIGPSFGNNFNNRTEEAIGSALDLWTAYREGVFGSYKAPWLGYFLLLEDCKKSNDPIKANSPHFPVLDEFIGASYKKRYEVFCGKLLLERQYNAACFMVSKGLPDGIDYEYPRPDLSCRDFAVSMICAAGSYFA